MSAVYLQNERRYNYTTPKSFLEQISLYSKLLMEKTYDLQAMISRLTDGLVKLESCATQVIPCFILRVELMSNKSSFLLAFRIKLKVLFA